MAPKLTAKEKKKIESAVEELEEAGVDL